MNRRIEKLANPVRGFFLDLLDFVYPPLCAFCGRGLSRAERIICQACWLSLSRISLPLCSRCGLPLSDFSGLCSACRSHSHIFSFARSYGLFDETVQQIVHLFKFRDRRCLSQPLGALMAEVFRSDARYWGMDALAPVPLHPVRRRARGYDQSLLLCQALAGLIGKPILKKVLLRRINTASQSKLNLLQRRDNVEDAFRVSNPQSVAGRRVILVDDVLTTGSTADACAAALLSAGAAEVSVITVARAAEPGTAQAQKG